MPTQLYDITRTGAQFRRWEWPDGTPVKGPRMERGPDGHAVPIKRDGGVAQLVFYGAGRRERNTHLLTPGVRTQIRLSDAGAATLAHLGLRPVLGTRQGAEDVSEAPAPAPLPSTSQDPGTAPEAVKVPEGWRQMKPAKIIALAAKISGEPADGITIEQAAAIVEAYVAAGAANAG